MIIFGAQVIPNLISESPFKLVPLIWPLWALPCFLVQAVGIKRIRIESISASHIIRINIVWGNFCFPLETCMFWVTVQTVFLSVGHSKKKTLKALVKRALSYLSVHSFIYLKISFLPPALLRYNWHVTLCKFKVYSVMIWITYILQNDYHNNVS